MYYEVITEVLPGVKLYIDLSEGGVQKLLPLENFIGDDSASTLQDDTASSSLSNNTAGGAE